jgi:membrane-bound lytic murein transglycosylase B
VIRLAFFTAALLLAVPQQPTGPEPQPPTPEEVVQAPKPFDEWLRELMDEARARGYADEIVGPALSRLEPLVRVVQHDRTQAELTVGFERYFESRVNATVVRRGKEVAREHRALLSRVERTYGVSRRIILAIWGIESRYGRNTGRTPVFQALATLAWEPRRADFFRSQLFDALTMVASGHAEIDMMKGSWAGAMGQTQFMPSSYLEYAVDQDGDGHRNIWTSAADVVASIANYLKGHGWARERTWGREVRVTPAAQRAIEKASIRPRESGCFAMRDMTERRPLRDWQRFGVRNTDRTALPRAAIDASLVEIGDRWFLVYDNYDALLRYNCAHHYALSVAMLAERLR